MKLKFYNTSAFIAILITVAFLSRRQVCLAQCGHPRIDFINEDILDLDDFYKDEQQAGMLQNYFNNNVGYTAAHTPIDPSPEVIQMSAIAQLYDIARTQATCNPCVTGLRIIFGMRLNKMVFFYQPVFMCYDISQEGYMVNSSVLSQYYRYNTTTKLFEPVMQDTVTAYCQYYYDNVYIDHFEDGNYAPFTHVSQDVDWHGDTKSIIFSFQELFALYEANYPNESAGNRYCEDVIIRNAAAYYYRFKINKDRLKHTLYVKTNGDGAVLYAANLAHLCPPSCNQLNYTAQ